MKVALVRLPLFWQVLSLVHEACGRAGCTLFANERDNMPLANAAVRSAEANIVLTDAKDAYALSLFLAEKNTRMPNWFIVHETKGDWTTPVMLDSDAKIVQEVHLFPGVPLLVQCEDLSKQRSASFHAASGIAIECLDETTLVTSAEAMFVPLEQYWLDVRLATKGTCSCGKEIFEKRT